VVAEDQKKSCENVIGCTVLLDKDPRRAAQGEGVRSEVPRVSDTW